MSNPRGTPANLKPFKKGQSGNPGGGPKGESATAAMLRLLQMPLEKVQKIAGDPKAKMVEVFAAQRILLGDSGNAKHVLDRTEGPVKEQSEVQGHIVVEFITIENPHSAS